MKPSSCIYHDDCAKAERLAPTNSFVSHSYREEEGGPLAEIERLHAALKASDLALKASDAKLARLRAGLMLRNKVYLEVVCEGDEIKAALDLIDSYNTQAPPF